MKHIIMSVSCFILFVCLTSCSGLTLSTGSCYNDYTANGEDANIDMKQFDYPSTESDPSVENTSKAAEEF